MKCLLPAVLWLWQLISLVSQCEIHFFYTIKPLPRTRAVITVTSQLLYVILLRCVCVCDLVSNEPGCVCFLLNEKKKRSKSRNDDIEK